MITRYLVAAAVAVNFTVPALGQSSGEADANSSSSSQLILQSDTDATIYTDQRTYGDYGDGVADGEIKQRIESTGIANAPDFGSGHPCALGTSGAVGFVGGALSGGASRVDYGCMMLRAGATAEGFAYYAMMDRRACLVLRQTGKISPQSDCGDGGIGQTVSSRSQRVVYDNARPERPDR